MSYFDLLDALKGRGCPACTLLQRDAARFLDALMYEFTADNATIETIRASRGLCNLHAWQMRESKGNSGGIAMLHRSALRELVSLLKESSGKGGAVGASAPLLRLLGLGQAGDGALTAERLAPNERCLCCTALETSEEGYLLALSGGAGEAEFQALYRASDGLCLPHFRRLLPRISQPNVVQTLIEMQAAIWQALADDMQIFIDKVAARQNAEDFTAGESSSWVRMVESLAGGKGAFGFDQRRG